MQNIPKRSFPYASADRPGKSVPDAAPCAEICNSSLFVFDRGVDRFPRIKFPEECWHCDSCVLDCPVGAISLRIPLSYGLMHVDASTLTTKEAKS